MISILNFIAFEMLDPPKWNVQVMSGFTVQEPRREFMVEEGDVKGRWMGKISQGPRVHREEPVQTRA